MKLNLIKILPGIKRTYDTKAFNFFVFICHIYMQLKSRTSFGNNLESSAIENTNKQIRY